MRHKVNININVDLFFKNNREYLIFIEKFHLKMIESDKHLNFDELKENLMLNYRKYLIKSIESPIMDNDDSNFSIKESNIEIIG